MRRRAFITLLAGAATWSRGARAQQAQARVPVIGFLSSRSTEEAKGHTAGFLRGLEAFGYVDGRSVAIEYRWAHGRYDQLPALANELTALQPAVLVAPGGMPSARAAKRATSVIPVLFLTSDTEKEGLVASLSRPGGNATGVDLMTGELAGKRLELLTQLVPAAKVVGFLTNAQGEISALHSREAEAAARALGRKLVVVAASITTELAQSFSTLAANGVGALVVENDPAFDSRRDQLMALAADHRLPAIYHIREFPAAGGLMSYGPSLTDAYYQLGVQTGRVLRGANPADLPVIRPTRFELVINPKTAATLGLTVPLTLFAQADEVIE
jgi:putative ABC transport system substrate-binding protein